MKRAVVVLISLIFVLAMAGIASAQVNPHGGYSTGTDLCGKCHEIHEAASPFKLLVAASVYATCVYCHPVGADIYVITGEGARHDPNGGITDIPGGGSLPGDSPLSCDSCHTPHATLAVNSYTTDSTDVAQSRALKKAGDHGSDARRLKGPGTDSSDDYDSLWCADCHNARHTGADNHPVATQSGAIYNDVDPGTIGNQPLGVGFSGTYNRYAMTPSYNTKNAPIPNNPVPYSSLNLICQQCHEDTRNADTVSYDLGVNPLYTDFPHETENDSFVIEGGVSGGTMDDLCLNCHDLDILP